MKILPCGIAVLEGDLWASRWIEEQGRLDYDPTISQVLEPMLKPGDTAIDVGAMFGAYAFGFKRAVGPRGNVFAFEPNPKAFECLKHNCPDVNCFNHALGATYSTGTLEPHETNPGKTRVKNVVGRGNVPVDTLDWEPLSLKSLNLLKVDVEGMEPDVISGGIETIKRLRPIIYIEINHSALQENGFTFKDVIGPLQALGYVPRHLKEGLSFDRQQCPEIDVIMMP